MRFADRSPFDGLIPLWVALSLALHVVVVIAASGAMAPRLHQGLDIATSRVILAGKVASPRTPAPPQAKVSKPASRPPRRPKRATVTNRRPHGEPMRPQPAGVVRTAAQVAAKPQAKPQRGVPAKTEGHTAPARPQKQDVQPIVTPAAQPKPAGPAAGGEAQVIALRETAAGGFSVASPPVTGGRGIGIGGSGAGLGVGGSGTDGAGSKTKGVQAGGVPDGGDGTPGGQESGAGGIGGGSGALPQQAEEAPAADDDSPPSPPTSQPAARKPPASTQAVQVDLSEFAAMVQRRISRARHYPPAARNQGEEGIVKVRFWVTPAGRPAAVKVISSSGHRSLDLEAVRAVHRAAPFLPFPKGVDKRIAVTATVIFKLN